MVLMGLRLGRRGGGRLVGGRGVGVGGIGGVGRERNVHRRLMMFVQSMVLIPWYHIYLIQSFVVGGDNACLFVSLRM